MNVLKLNFKSSGYSCDWAIIAYSGNVTVLEDACEYGKELGINIVHCHIAPPLRKVINQYKAIKSTVKRKSTNYPKAFLYLLLYSVSKEYERVWVLDNDILIAETNITAALETLLCARNSHNYISLISQPLIEGVTNFVEGTRQYWGHAKDKCLATSNFIEIMAPIFEATFFRWFLDAVVVPLIEPFYVLGSDWGLDTIWCGAALYYHTELFKKEPKVDGACTLLLSHQIKHLDLKSARKESPLQHKDAYFLNSEKMKSLTKETFNQWHYKKYRSTRRVLDCDDYQLLRCEF
jgi:hypothetical protein